MIIQCIKCSTKFRFDESLMEGDGVWVRCSRCQEVFFQENPVKPEPAEPEPVKSVQTEAEQMTPEFVGAEFAEHESVKPELAEPEPVKSELAAAELEEAAPVMADVIETVSTPDSEFPDFDKTVQLSASKEEINSILAKVEEAKKAIDEHHESPAFADVGDDIRKDDESETGEVEIIKPFATGHEEPEGKDVLHEPAKGGFWTSFRIIALIVLINLVFGGVYLWFFQGIGERAIQSLSSSVPFIGDLLGTEKKSQEFKLSQIKLQEVRQRFVNNLVAGKLRVIDGVAVNSSTYPVTRLQIKGELYDSNGVIITERLAYGGNLLSDDELATLPEEALQKELDLPMGSDAQNIRIEPKGQIPFMVIFPHEPPGVVKAKVATVGGEKLVK
ncbi:MAG: hypothetical protein A4E66_00722 [Syntrophus sp. PtaB.Bin001]|nr:MAG: hypothetical protein A4E66_00722 [Syntrophus sp. PtaB.Bin001]